MDKLKTITLAAALCSAFPCPALGGEKQVTYKQLDATIWQNYQHLFQKLPSPKRDELIELLVQQEKKKAESLLFEPRLRLLLHNKIYCAETIQYLNQLLEKSFAPVVEATKKKLLPVFVQRAMESAESQFAAFFLKNILSPFKKLSSAKTVAEISRLVTKIKDELEMLDSYLKGELSDTRFALSISRHQSVALELLARRIKRSPEPLVALYKAFSVLNTLEPDLKKDLALFFQAEAPSDAIVKKAEDLGLEMYKLKHCQAEINWLAAQLGQHGCSVHNPSVQKLVDKQIPQKYIKPHLANEICCRLRDVLQTSLLHKATLALLGWDCTGRHLDTNCFFIRYAHFMLPTIEETYLFNLYEIIKDPTVDGIALLAVLNRMCYAPGVYPKAWRRHFFPVLLRTAANAHKPLSPLAAKTLCAAFAFYMPDKYDMKNFLETDPNLASCVVLKYLSDNIQEKEKLLHEMPEGYAKIEAQDYFNNHVLIAFAALTRALFSSDKLGQALEMIQNWSKERLDILRGRHDIALQYLIRHWKQADKLMSIYDDLNALDERYKKDMEDLPKWREDRIAEYR